MTDNRADTFRALHEQDQAFVIPNPFSAGTAMLLESMGFEALATTSSGHAYSMGRPDGMRAVDRDEAIRRMMKQKLLFDPGTGRSHSHGAFGLLAAIVEIVSGQSYYGFIREHFLDRTDPHRADVGVDREALPAGQLEDPVDLVV